MVLKCCELLFILFYVSASAGYEEDPTGFMTANGVNITILQYMFHDGEVTNFTCHKTSEGKVQLLHTARDGLETDLTGYQNNDSVSEVRKLKRGVNGGETMKCTFTTKGLSRSKVIAVWLTAIKDGQDNASTIPPALTSTVGQEDITGKNTSPSNENMACRSTTLRNENKAYSSTAPSNEVIKYTNTSTSNQDNVTNSGVVWSLCVALIAVVGLNLAVYLYTCSTSTTSML